MQQVSTNKMAEMCGCKPANIRNMINRGSLNATKDAYGEHLIDLDDPKNRDYYNARKLKMQNPAQPTETNIAKPEETPSNQPQPITTGVSDDTMRVITERIEYLATLAGEAKQLQAGLIEGKKDAEYWRNLYLELQHSIDTLRNEKEELIKRNAVLEFDNERLRKPFWSWKK